MHHQPSPTDGVRDSLSALLAGTGHDLSVAERSDRLAEARLVADLTAAYDVLDAVEHTPDAHRGANALVEYLDDNDSDEIHVAARRLAAQTRNRALVVGPHEATTIAYYLPEAFAVRVHELGQPSHIEDLDDARSLVTELAQLAEVARQLRGVTVGDPVAIAGRRQDLRNVMTTLQEGARADLVDERDADSAASAHERHRHLRVILDRIDRTEA